MYTELKKIKVANMTGNTGREVSNQFIIWTSEGTYFQSYDSIICFRKNDGTIYLDSNTWDYSSTTSKYRNIFLGETTAETKKNIKNKNYILTNLNN